MVCVTGALESEARHGACPPEEVEIKAKLSAWGEVVFVISPDKHGGVLKFELFFFLLFFYFFLTTLG